MRLFIAVPVSSAGEQEVASIIEVLRQRGRRL